MRRQMVRTIAAGAACLLVLAGCGGDDANADAEAGVPAAAAGVGGNGDGDGTLTLDGESIALTTVRCFLEPQDAAGVGGRILFTGQGTGDNAAGEPVLIDVSRYDEQSAIPGDAVSLTIGDPFSPESANYDLTSGEGAIDRDGATLSGEDVALPDFEAGGEVSVSFHLDC